MAGANDPNRPALPDRAAPKMSAAEYERAIRKLNLSQIRAARFFGISDKQGQRLATGQIEVPPTIAHLLKLMLRHRVAPSQLDPNFK